MNDMIETGTALTVLPVASLPTILAADQNDILGSLLRELEGWQPDVSTERGRKEIASKAQKVRIAKADFERLADTLKEDAIKTQRAVNAEFKILEARMKELVERVRAPLTEFENREKTRVAEHEAAIARIDALLMDVAPGASVATISEAIVALNDLKLTGRDWEEFGARASRKYTEAEQALNREFVAARKREEEAAELARLRAEETERQRLAAIETQRVREEQIAAEAAERARTEAEARAARDAKESEGRAQAALQAAARREQEAADVLARAEREKQETADRVEAARVAAEQKAERDRVAAIEAERQKIVKEQQRADYHRSMLQHVKNCGFGFIGPDPQPLGILQYELTEKIRYDEENFGALLPEALVARDAALAMIQKSVDESNRRHAIEAERQRVAREAETQRGADAKRAANRAHQAAINREVLADLVAAINDNQGGEFSEEKTEDVAKAVIAWIVKGQVRHISIKY